mmetsp:Transcript_31015/g.65999  ORF Transcript_31015/g.65999 Transcript_31015/m.65999 type:complete len:533 (-) Transcript_31015:20-1618(-)
MHTERLEFQNRDAAIWDAANADLSAEMIANGRQVDTPESLSDMAQYTELHLTRLLKPFAEHLLELQDSIRELSEHVARTDAHLHAHEARLDDSKNWTVQIKGTLAGTNAHLVALQNGLKKTNEEKAVLEGKQEEIAVEVVEIQRFVRDTKAEDERVRETLAVNVADHARLRSEFATTRQHVQECLEPNLRQAMQDLADLTSFRGPMQTRVETTRSMVEELDRDLKEFKKIQQIGQEDDQATFASFNTQLQSVKTKVTTLEREEKDITQELKHDTQDLDELKQRVQLLSSDKVLMNDKLDTLNKNYVNTKLRVDPLEKGLFQLLEAANKPLKDKEGQKNRRNIGEYLSELEVMVTACGKRLDDFDKGQQAQDAQLVKSAAGLRQEIKGVEDKLFGTNSDIKGLVGQHESALGLISNVMAQQEAAKVKEGETLERFNGVRHDLHDLQSQITSNREGISKLGANLELCHEHFSGLRKGFKEVASNEAMLPEPARSKTPVLPNMRASPTPWGAARENAGSPALAWSARGNLRNPSP